MRYSLFLFSIFCSSILFAQTPAISPDSIHRSHLNAITKQYTQALNTLNRRFSSWKYTGKDLLSNPYYFPLLSGSTMLDGTVKRSIGTLPEWEYAPDVQQLQVLREIDALLMDAYISHPDIISYDAEAMKADGIRNDLDSIVVAPEERLADKIAVAPDAPPSAIVAETPIEITVSKPNFWKFKTNFSMQFMQNHVSDNWYKGGESNYSMLTSLTVEANYDNKEKVQFDNKLEMKLGFQTTKNDDAHKFKTNSDLIRLTNKLGVKAVKNWYYTAMLQSWTQFHPGYKSNDKKIYSDFMSPFESVFSIGMDYKLSKKKFNLNATISPIAVKFKYVDRKALATSFGLDEGKHTKFEYGSTITMNYDWTICKNVNWKGRIYFFSDYSKSQIEWENTFSMTVNKFLSTKLFLYPRFDDSVKRKEGMSYIQFNEWFSVGLDFNF